MPKLPVDYVKAPGFDNPLRATAARDSIAERQLVLRLNERSWDALLVACERERSTPEALVQRALDRYLAEPDCVAVAPLDAAVPGPSPRTQMLEQLREQFVRRSWIQCVLTMRAILRESRA
jgi:hypothetical protein